MDKCEVARLVLQTLGGRGNVLTNAVCMTRLRVTLSDPTIVDFESLGDIQGVLGTALRSQNGIEVVFGPRVIDGIYREFTKLTGISASPDDLFPMSRQDSNMRVQIHTNRSVTRTSTESSNQPLIDDHEMSVLEDLFGGLDDEPEDKPAAKALRLVVINGPNINMLGVPANGSSSEDYPALLELCKQTAQEAGFARCDCFQSNHEGDLVDIIQDAYGVCDAIVINPGAYGSSSALQDALQAVGIPSAEVHLHRLDSQDAVASACVTSVTGLGIPGYQEAILTLADYLKP